METPFFISCAGHALCRNLTFNAMIRMPQNNSSLPKNSLAEATQWSLPQGPVDLRPSQTQDSWGREVLNSSFTASKLDQALGKIVTIYGYLVTLKPVRTVKGEIMNFGSFIDCEGSYFDTVHFPPSLKQHPFRGNGVYRIRGKVVDEFGFLSIEVQHMHKLNRKPDPRSI